MDPSLLDASELDRLAEMVLEVERPALVGREGVRIDLPDPVFHLLVRVIRSLREGRSVVVLPEDEAFITQATANFLGMSRQFFVELLERGELPYHRVGTHRRVLFRDLAAYGKKRGQPRRESWTGRPATPSASSRKSGPSLGPRCSVPGKPATHGGHGRLLSCHPPRVVRHPCPLFPKAPHPCGGCHT